MALGHGTDALYETRPIHQPGKKEGGATTAPIQTHSVSLSHPSPDEHFLVEHKAGLLCCRSLRVHPGGAGWDLLWLCRNNPSLQQRMTELEQM